MPRVERDRELARRRQRKKQLAKLRKRYANAHDRAEKEAVQEKLRKVSPFAVLEEPKK